MNESPAFVFSRWPEGATTMGGG